MGWRNWPIERLDEKRWMPGLRRVRPAVKQLYYRGQWDKQIFKKAVAVVGSRRMTHYGEAMTRKIVTGLVEAGYTIVSGFMYGVDTMAHKTCLDNGGKTVAVLGSGLDCPTPAENDQLYTRILEGGGLVVSEFEAKQEAMLWTFPYRNRIVVALSQAVVVVEAGEKSGSLVTARWAFKQKKPVLAVPGPATSSLAAGTNWLLKNGAKLAADANDVLAELGDSLQVEYLKAPVKMNPDEARVVELLKREALDADEIGRQLGQPISAVAVLLSNLGLKGVIEESGGKWVVK